MSPALILLHAPSVYDFRQKTILYGPVSDLIPPSPVFEMYPIGFTSIAEYLERAGYQATPLEYFDVDDRFHVHPWSAQDGFVMRSFRFDFQVRFRRDDMFYTSLIVDARKE